MIRLLKKLYSRFLALGFWFRRLRLNGKENISVDKTCIIHQHVRVEIYKGGSIAIGPNSELMPGVMILTYGGKIEIGMNCSINHYSILYGHGGLKIGNNVLIAGGTMIIPSNHTFTDPKTPIIFQGNTAKGIVIEDDVWIGHGCSILDGIRIKQGSVIAAGSVVTADVEPYTVVAGVPARIIKRRD